MPNRELALHACSVFIWRVDRQESNLSLIGRHDSWYPAIDEVDIHNVDRRQKR
jgi:hypothetical protein